MHVVIYGKPIAELWRVSLYPDVPTVRPQTARLSGGKWASLPTSCHLAQAMTLLKGAISEQKIPTGQPVNSFAEMDQTDSSNISKWKQ